MGRARKWVGLALGLFKWMENHIQQVVFCMQLKLLIKFDLQKTKQG